MTDALSPQAAENTSSPIQQPGSDVAATRWLAVGSLLALIALCVAWELWLAPVRSGGTLLYLKALPLAFGVIGLLKRRMYTYRWLSLLCGCTLPKAWCAPGATRPPAAGWHWAKCCCVSCSLSPAPPMCACVSALSKPLLLPRQPDLPSYPA